MAKYNGYKNWNHWNVSLWVNNDEGLYRMALDCIEHTGNREDAVNSLMEVLPAKTPDGAPYSKSSVRSATAGMKKSR